MTHETIYDLWEQQAYCCSRNFHKHGSRLSPSRAPGLLWSMKGMWSSAGRFIGRIDRAGGQMDAVWLQTHNIAACLITLAAMLLSSIQCQKPSCRQSAFPIVPMVTVVLESVSATVPASLEHLQIKVFPYIPLLVCFVYKWDVFEMREEHLLGGLMS